MKNFVFSGLIFGVLYGIVFAVRTIWDKPQYDAISILAGTVTTVVLGAIISAVVGYLCYWIDRYRHVDLLYPLKLMWRRVRSKIFSR